VFTRKVSSRTYHWYHHSQSQSSSGSNFSRGRVNCPTPRLSGMSLTTTWVYPTPRSPCSCTKQYQLAASLVTDGSPPTMMIDPSRFHLPEEIIDITLQPQCWAKLLSPEALLQKAFPFSLCLGWTGESGTPVGLHDGTSSKSTFGPPGQLERQRRHRQGCDWP